MTDAQDSNWAKARSSIVWMLAIVVAFGAVWWIEKESGKELIAKTAAPPLPTLASSKDVPADPAPRPLTADELRYAKTAWTYFENNTDKTTGLTGAVDGFAGTTMWDAGSALMALLSAHELGLVDKARFDERMSRALASLAKLPLYAASLPNKSYDIRTLEMTDYNNKPSPNGVGWSAIDVGRLMVPLTTIAWRHPQHTPQARAVIARWKTGQLARGGQLFGMQAGTDGQAPQSLQEGRLGYEQYAARTFYLLGLDVEQALDWRPHLKLVDVEGVQVPVDAREPAKFGAQNFVVSEPFMLTGLELGFTGSGREAAWRVYRAQEARWRKTQQLTAVTEDHVDRAPWFVYNAVHSNGRNWVAASDKGEEAAALRNVSTKAAFAWHALYRNEYTQKLVAAVAPLNDPAKGWYAGLYEQGGQPNKAIAANTNAVILESLAYTTRGTLLSPR
ncbi:DUF3131 domain-containing protein [Ramlibacter albus]|uniref:DUF3131 domain-containing protein n=1 Tax=Ramlibacter albus TaxID=2079448 RepID=A0A923S1Z5_9BURK|nr:DUF3131 domain-containing protein [Ramlibacter albus]MBC5764213.1 DUF3131 domain-containing protein [Ramlibacter albus]